MILPVIPDSVWIKHFIYGPGMAGMVPVPGGVLWVYLTGAALLAGAAAIITNFNHLGPMAGLLVAILLAIFAFTIHLPGVVNAAPGQEMASMANLLKDLGLAGGALVIAGSYR